MAGASIPLTPAVHQMISVGPVPQFADTVGEITFPIVRDMDTFCYERQHGGDMEVGSYAHRPILYDPEEIPSIQQSTLSPTELPFTSDDFDLQLEQALELMPDILGNPAVGIRYAINGLLSLTPDGAPVLGESPEVKGLWSAAAVWIKEGPGVGRTVAEWMVDGTPGDRPALLGHRPLLPDAAHPRARARAHQRGVQQDVRHRAPRRAVGLGPRRAAEPDARAASASSVRCSSRRRAGSGRSGTSPTPPLLETVRRRRHAAQRGVGRPLVVADHQRRAPRDARGCRAGRPVGVQHLRRPRPGRAGDRAERARSRRWTSPVGRVVYTPVLNAAGGIKSDLTIMRLGDEHFRVVTGGLHGNADRKWFADHAPADGSAQVVDQTNAFTTIGLWGPSARDILASVTRADVSHEAFAFGTCREIEVGSQVVLASRISYVGELGWELYVSFEQGARLWRDAATRRASTHGLVPVGIGVYGTTGRLEKGYRAHGAELDLERTLVEAGMSRKKRQGRRTSSARPRCSSSRAQDPVTILCTLTVDDHTSADGTKRYMLGREPVLTADGDPITDKRGHRSYVTSAGSAPSLGTHLLMTYLPPEYAVEGTAAVGGVHGRAVPGARSPGSAPQPLFDPDNDRIRG